MYSYGFFFSPNLLKWKYGKFSVMYGKEKQARKHLKCTSVNLFIAPAIDWIESVFLAF